MNWIFGFLGFIWIFASIIHQDWPNKTQLLLMDFGGWVFFAIAYIIKILKDIRNKI